MKFYSTRDKNSFYDLKEAALMGLAPDGGLFMPENIPAADIEEVVRLSGLSFQDVAVYLARLFFGDSLPEQELEGAINRALSFDIPLKKIVENPSPLYTLELFYGPTCAFKDVGASCMGQILCALRRGSDRKLIILTATSGDTGSAVAAGFYNIPGIEVVVLFPDGKVSPLQEAQMTTLGGNIHAVKVKGTFDDCQRLVKEMFNNKELRKSVEMTSANSINLLRWIPQSFYYFYAYAKLLECKGASVSEGVKPVFVVPSGNYGNISAGMMAKKMGLPVKRFVAASNANDVFPKYLETGSYNPMPSIKTIANAMDVGNPSNYERILDLYDGSYRNIVSDVVGYSCCDDTIRAGIKELWDDCSYISCPHSAVGYNAAKFFRDNYADGVSDDIIWLSTAAAGKFSEVIEPVIGRKIDIPKRLRDRMEIEKRYFTEMEADGKALEEYLRKTF